MKLNIQKFAVVDYNASSVNALNSKVSSTIETIDGLGKGINGKLQTLSDNTWNKESKRFGDGFQAKYNGFIDSFNSYISSFGAAVEAVGRNYQNTFNGEAVNSFSGGTISKFNVTFVGEKGGREGGDDTAAPNFNSSSAGDRQSIHETIQELTDFTNSSDAFDENTMSTLRSTISSCNAQSKEFSEMTFEEFVTAGGDLAEAMTDVQSGAKRSFSGEGE